jgi:dihydroflavonol-4-reductase
MKRLPATAAVTGASGHVGAALSRALLERGADLRVLVHKDTRALDGLAARRVAADLADTDSLCRAFRGVKVVYHLAARIELDRRGAERMHRVNVEGTRNVISACRICGVHRLVHFSSIEALSDLNPSKPTDERNPLAGPRETTRYGWTKAQAERLVLEAAGQGLETVIMSPTAIIGPYDCKPSHLGKSLLDLYHHRMPALVRGGFNWVDVRDVVEASLSASDRGRNAERYIVSGTWLSLPDLAVLVEAITGRKAPPLNLPLWLARGVAAFTGKLPGLSARFPAFTPDALLAVAKHRQVSCEKARKELNYRPRPLEDTVRETFRWFRDRGVLEDWPLQAVCP